MQRERECSECKLLKHEFSYVHITPEKAQQKNAQRQQQDNLI